MNNKDKEAFEKWHDENIANPPTLNELINRAWIGACEYKQKEIDELEKEKDYLCKKMENMREIYKNSEKLQDENAKLIECVEFYANGTHWDLDQLTDPSDIEEINVMNRRIEYSSGKRARQVLKELNNTDRVINPV